jgi:hypothetical protein
MPIDRLLARPFFPEAVRMIAAILTREPSMTLAPPGERGKGTRIGLAQHALSGRATCRSSRLVNT